MLDSNSHKVIFQENINKKHDTYSRAVQFHKMKQFKKFGAQNDFEIQMFKSNAVMEKVTNDFNKEKKDGVTEEIPKSNLQLNEEKFDVYQNKVEIIIKNLQD